MVEEEEEEVVVTVAVAILGTKRFALDALF